MRDRLVRLSDESLHLHFTYVYDEIKRRHQHQDLSVWARQWQKAERLRLKDRIEKAIEVRKRALDALEGIEGRRPSVVVNEGGVAGSLLPLPGPPAVE